MVKSNNMVERIRSEHKPTDTLTTLAVRLSITRSALSGYYNRNKVLRETHPLAGVNPGIVNTVKPDSAIQRKYAQRATRIKAKQAAALQPIDVQEPSTPRPPRRVDPVAEPIGYTLVELPANGCKWPYGDPGTFTFCGHDRGDDRRYCAGHAKLSRGDWNDRHKK